MKIVWNDNWNPRLKAGAYMPQPLGRGALRAIYPKGNPLCAVELLKASYPSLISFSMAASPSTASPYPSMSPRRRFRNMVKATRV